MKPIDPRLLRLIRHDRSAWQLLWIVIGLGLSSAVLLIAQAILIAGIVVAGMRSQPMLGWLVGLGAVVLGRAACGWLGDVTAARLAISVKARLRDEVIAGAVVSGPQRSVGEVASLATIGMDTLDAYFARYLPAVVLGAMVPVAVIGTLGILDWSVAVTVLLTVPLIPLFAALVGWATQRHTNRQWRVLTTLAGHFLDVVSGLTTLRVFGRAKAQVETVRRVTDQHRRASMRTFRLAFLSSGALELVATISVALVAVSVGLRLVHDGIGLFTAVAVLVLAPEAYWPLRRMGAEYHAAVGGVAVLDQVGELSTVQWSNSAVEIGDFAAEFDQYCGGVVNVREVAVAGRLVPVSFTVRPQELVAIVGESGAGKSTLLTVLAGFLGPTAGAVVVEENLVQLASARWRARLAWLPQHPYLGAGQVWRAVALGAADATRVETEAALDRVGLAELADVEIGDDGAGLSAGQRQRVALARLILRASRLTDGLILIDEPTAFLDPDTEQLIIEVLSELRREHRLIVVTHRAAVRDSADVVVTIRPARVSPADSAGLDKLQLAPANPMEAVRA